MPKYMTMLSLFALLLAATLLEGATPQQARITLVERNTASSILAGAQPSVVRKQVPGQPDHEAYRFSQTVHVGLPVTEVVRVAFHQPTTLKSIDASNDFHVASSSCQMGRTYNEGDSCDVSVTLIPRGPGKRAGLLTFVSTESATPDTVGLQGHTQGPALSFIPAQISTIPQSLPKGIPLLNKPMDIVTDQGDNLYISDWYIGSNTSIGGAVYMMDGSNTMTTLIGGGTLLLTSGDVALNAVVELGEPYGIAVDSFLDLYTTDFSTNGLYETSGGYTSVFAGEGSTPAHTCTPASPCTPSYTSFFAPGWVNIDENQNLYLDDGYAFYTIPLGGKLSAFAASTTSSLEIGAPAFGLDSADDLYGLEKGGGPYVPVVCKIAGVDLSDGFSWDAAGSGVCGSAGNNIRSQSAEISEAITGYAFDAAGDMYFTDWQDGEIRRVDSYNGLIRTAAGNNALGYGYSGDGGPATAAQIAAPEGVAVDSNGNLYTTSVDTSLKAAPYYVVRKIGPAGQINFPTTILVGQSSVVETALLTNTGNDDLTVSNQVMGGANPGDFIPDPATSSCTWIASLASGRSCQLGFTCKPTAAGMRTATVTFADNTATLQNQLNLKCYAIASPATSTVTITAPANGAQFIAGSNVTIGAAVSNTITAQPTQPTGTVSLTVTNTGTSTTAATFNGVNLAPQARVSKSNIPNQTFKNAPAGNYSISATYSGDTLDTAGTATPVTFSMVQVTPTVTITTPANNSSFLPGSVTASVTVSNAGLTPTAPSPTGSLTVTLTNTATSSKQTFNATLSGGSGGNTTVSVPLGSLAVGKYTVSAAYAGDIADKSATSATNTLSVVQLTPTVAIMSPIGNGTYSYPLGVPYTAQVSNAGLTPADASAPTGTVTFTVTNLGTSGQTTYGPYTLGTGSGGVVSFSTLPPAVLTVASYSITASYSGDADDVAVTSSAVDFSVTPATPTINWPTPAPIPTGTPLSSAQLDATATNNVSATVAGTYVYTPPAGTVMSTPGQVPLQVTFHPTDTIDYNQASGSVLLTVGGAGPAPPSSIFLSAGQNPAVAGQALTFVAAVTSNNSVEPTGSVSLLENGKVLTSAPLKGGKASLTLANLAPGTHSLIASYSGDAFHGASQSQPLKQVVTDAGFHFAHEPAK